MRRRTLALRRETLSQLATDDLAAVVGAQDYTPTAKTLPVKDCLLMQTYFCPTER